MFDTSSNELPQETKADRKTYDEDYAAAQIVVAARLLQRVCYPPEGHRRKCTERRDQQEVVSERPVVQYEQADQGPREPGHNKIFVLIDVRVNSDRLKAQPHEPNPSQQADKWHTQEKIRAEPGDYAREAVSAETIRVCSGGYFWPEKIL